MNKPIIKKIESSTLENYTIKTLTFSSNDSVIPGQFFMIWIPGFDEIPMSVSVIKDDVKGITFRGVGEATKQLFSLNENDKIGIRGPYGNGFSMKGDNVLIVGGGTGIAMIAPLVEYCINQNKNVDVLLGAKTKNELFFIKRLEDTSARVQVSTDDGSMGFCGFASDCCLQVLEDHSIDSVYTCGPEMMMKSLFDICEKRNLYFEASLERYMKCAVGICGQCCVGKGVRVCVEGPIFNKDMLKNISEFGSFTRDASGKKTKL